MSILKKSLMTLALVGGIISQANASDITMSFGGTGAANVETFDELALGLNTGTVALPSIGAQLTFGGAAVQQGNQVNTYQTPFGDSTKYLATFGGGSATFTFTQPVNYIGMLMGSVDTYNTISFYDSSNTLIASFVGNDIITGAGLNPTDPGPNGTVYANFNSTVEIAKVVTQSSINAFEIDNLSVAQVPLPASLPMFGAVLLGLGAFGYRKKLATA
jgi:hypothetical protein